MDELFAIAKRLDDAFIRFASETENQATSRRNQAVKDAATALRASQAEIARLRKELLAAYAALDNGAEREDVKDDIHAALKGEPD
jgi:hypothetical protein